MRVFRTNNSGHLGDPQTVPRRVIAWTEESGAERRYNRQMTCYDKEQAQRRYNSFQELPEAEFVDWLNSVGSLPAAKVREVLAHVAGRPLAYAVASRIETLADAANVPTTVRADSNVQGMVYIDYAGLFELP